ncbi:hypothetical protein [Kineococcus rhizosphaerae]|uniref:Uncharacterized protein n=1 Tax=Kineococcus rhizosphaerae TaxID=559628 RepID=A0A2T0QLL3_9ACTN|nr:hypothetical protein [Kineococcus rhizosphaerae]PRY05316.1 hypothetical protein CLV37_1403 [Kineococcus rhizosphaerae]
MARRIAMRWNQALRMALSSLLACRWQPVAIVYGPVRNARPPHLDPFSIRCEHLTPRGRGVSLVAMLVVIEFNMLVLLYFDDRRRATA